MKKDRKPTQEEMRIAQEIARRRNRIADDMVRSLVRNLRDQRKQVSI
jgi:hypothetical protein